MEKYTKSKEREAIYIEVLRLIIRFCFGFFFFVFEHLELAFLPLQELLPGRVIFGTKQKNRKNI